MALLLVVGCALPTGGVADGFVPLLCFLLACLMLSFVANPQGGLDMVVVSVVLVVVVGANLRNYKERQPRAALPVERLDYRGFVDEMAPSSNGLVRCHVCLVGDEGELDAFVYVPRDLLKRQGVGIGSAIGFNGLLNAPNDTPYGRWAAQQGVEAVAFVYNADLLPSSDSLRLAERLCFGSRFRLRLAQVRTRLLERCDRLPLTIEERAVVKAMTLGDRSDLRADIRQTYSATGTAHILALSGLHLNVITLAWLFLLRKVCRRRALRVVCIVAMIVSIWAFVLLTGSRVSLVRSAVMATMLALSIGLHQRGSALNSLGLAAILLIVFDARVVLDIGFQLSFLSVFALLLAAPLTALLAGLPRPVAYLIQLVGLCTIAHLSTAPLVAYYFNILPTYFFLGSCFAVPFAPVVIGAAFLYLLGLPIAFVTAPLIHLFHAVITALSRLPYSTIMIVPDALDVALCYTAFVLVALLIFRWWERHKWWINFLAIN